MSTFATLDNIAHFGYQHNSTIAFAYVATIFFTIGYALRIDY